MKSNEPIETDDPAYQQMMRSFQQIPNIDIHVESERQQKKETVQKATPTRQRKKTAKKTASRINNSTGSKREPYVQLVVTTDTKKQLLLAKSILEATTDTRLSMDDFLSALLDKGYKKLNPTASNILDTTFAKLQETGTDED